MTGITQTVPNYFGGISEQPDYIKEPGQVRAITNGRQSKRFCNFIKRRC